MDENRRLFPFPQPPFSAPATIPVPGTASSYLTVGPTQGSGWPPQNPSSPWVPPTALSSPYETSPPQNLSVYPPACQPIPVSPVFPTPQGQGAHAPITHFASPPPRRSITMPIPGLRDDTQAALGFYTGYALQAPIMTHTQSNPGVSGATQIPADPQRNQDDPYFEEGEDNHGISAMHDDGALAKTPHPPVNGGIKNLFRRKRRTQTLATPVSGPTLRCRLPECQTTITGDLAERFSGFCSTNDMSTAIRYGMATPCPGRERWVCPVGQAFCIGCSKGRR
ncbi:hypothetical protein EDB92DRAFT_333799 [Lactarius akahatsu]|uniref:Uncharacterized protein n=1 Tax=Lactarius akahatsu TaxID=416441 RepID=A0AAD4L7A7_9AGAM|nr:hypothetical protein EDB92DRAFT_333799 [Lactarius akahatsu]